RTRILWRTTNRRQRLGIALSRLLRCPCRQCRRTHTWELWSGAEVEIERAPTVAYKKVEVVLLARRRAAKDIDAGGRRRTLVVIAGERAGILNHTIRAGLSLCSKLTLENALINLVNTDAELTLPAE